MQSLIVIQVQDKLHENMFIFTCSFHWYNERSWENVLEAYGKKLIYWKDITMVYVHIGIASMKQFQCIQNNIYLCFWK